MPRGGRSSGGGGRGGGGWRGRSAPPPAKAKGAPAPATTGGGGGSILGNVASSFADAWVWASSFSMANRAMDYVFGPRTFRIEHTTANASATGQADAAPSDPCQIHAMAFQDCINSNGSDISRCQFYVNILNDCRSKGQVAVVQPSG